MKLDNISQRYKLINDMIKKAFEFEESLIHDSENDNDWGGSMSTIEYLTVIEEMIRTEGIFMSTFAEMEDMRSRDPDEKEVYLNIVDDALTDFVDTILLRRIELAFDHLNEWSFSSAGGKKFKKNYCKKLDELRKKYQDIYDL